MGRRSVPTDLVRNIELLVGVALPLFLTGVWLQDHLTGAGHWAHPLESAFFEWLSLIPVLAFVGILHTVALSVVASAWPRAATRATVILGAVLMVPLLVLAGRPVAMLARYAVPLAAALVVYALSCRIPGSRAGPDEDLRTTVREDELLGAERAPRPLHGLEASPRAEVTPRAPGTSREAR